MKRRTVLTGIGVSIASVTAGCLSAATTGDDNTADDNQSTAEDDDQAAGTPEENDPKSQIESYEEIALPRDFQTLQLGGCRGEELLPGGICSDEPRPLARVADTAYFESADPSVYGFVFDSESAVAQLDTAALDGLDRPGESHSDTDERPSEFVMETDFETESLLLIQSFFPAIPAELSVDFIGRLSEDEAYVTIETSAGSLEQITQLTTLARVTQDTAPETIIVGQVFERTAGSNPSYAVYTNDE